MTNHLFSRLLFFIFLILFSSCAERQEEPFFLDWYFQEGDPEGASKMEFDDTAWTGVNIPHDWSIEQSYTKENTAASTGFLPAGIGWYRKHFVLNEEPGGKHIRVEFDGVYNNSTVWINGVKLGERPYGYSSFSYEMSEHLMPAGEENVLAVRVDHSAYADSRWYTGSGIYRDVRLHIADEVHIPQWGLRITTPLIEEGKALVRLECNVAAGSRSGESVDLEIKIRDQEGKELQNLEMEYALGKTGPVVAEMEVQNPVLWSLEQPHLYSAEVYLKRGTEILDQTCSTFGIRSIRFDADQGFLLNGEAVKIKGVNLHHEAGCLGAAVPKDVWRMRVEKLQSVGCNAIRMAHNPHDPHLMDLCDEMGMLVMAEAFDEWSIPKAKSIHWLSDNTASGEAARSYPEVFSTWAERDLKDLLLRDFNHPSVIMWSIGNEIEWTYPYYPQASSYATGELDNGYYTKTPGYDAEKILARLREIHPGPDSLLINARKLSEWIREIDTTRFITAGTVHPSVGFATGFHDVLDVSGFNYRAKEYDVAHAAYPEARILGSENWVTWEEWKAVSDRDFVAGIFVWTGFAYMGEAGPWPRKGLNISLFDFAGYKSPRGHFFESFWVDKPKAYMVTVPLDKSEFSYSDEDGWSFHEREYEIPQMSWLRSWEWYEVFEKWNYAPGEEIMIQAYTSCEEAELLLNGKSQGIKILNDFEDRIMKWKLPYEPGSLELVGFVNGVEVDRHSHVTEGAFSQIELKVNRGDMLANYRDVLMVEAQLQDANGNPVSDQDQEIQFKIQGPARIIGIDNGSEYNVQDAKSDRLITFNGRAFLFVQSEGEKGGLHLLATASGIESETITIEIKK